MGTRKGERVRTERVVALLAASLLLAPAAAADEPGLEFSRDGRTWSSTLSGPLLDEDARIVPGGSTRSDVSVRNSSEHPATLSMILRDSSTTMPTDVRPRDDFRVRVAETEVRGSQVHRCRVVARYSLAPGEQQRIPISVSLPSASGNVSQRKSLSLSLRVHLVAEEAGNPCTSPGQPLPDPPAEDEGPDSGRPGDGAASPPEVPGRVDTGVGPLERGAVTDVLALGLLLVVVSLLVRYRRALKARLGGAARGRALSPASRPSRGGGPATR